MNDFAAAVKIVKLYEMLVESDTMKILESFVSTRLEELLLQGVKVNSTPQERDVNSGRYQELDYFLNRLRQEYDGARDLLKADTDEKSPDQ